jgi:7-cyano-7-deazaguanine synthase
MDRAAIDTLVLCSGGLDSVTLADKVAAERRVAGIVSFDYGQRHAKELDFARRCAERLGVRHDIVDIAMLGPLLAGSALTDDVAVPDGHYAEETMKITIVPNRNAVMLTIAYAIAAARGVDAVAAAMHGGDHFIYPDCRPAFLAAFAEMQRLALDGDKPTELYTPFADRSKAAIVSEGAALGTPFVETWSCYKGGAVHCGRCGTCVERREAFHIAAVPDPTTYADPDFWRGVV